MSYRNIEPIQIIPTQTISGTTPVVSAILNMRTLTRGAVEIAYGAGLTATFSVQGSVSGQNFQDIGVQIAPAAGSAGLALIDLSAFGAAYYQVVITPSSGSGVVTVWGCAKGQ